MVIQSFVSSQVLANVIFTIQQAEINSMTKNWDKKLLNTGYTSIQNISKIDVLDYCQERQNYLILIEVPYQCDQSFIRNLLL